MKKLYKILLIGCDDTTYIKIELEEEEYLLMKKIEIKSKKESTYGCMPTLKIKEVEKQ